MSVATTRLLDTAAGARGMVWVIAIMLFLTVLATAGGVGTARATQALGQRLAGRATVQVAVTDPAQREAETAQAAAALAGLRGVGDVRVVPRDELARVLAPWLGADGEDADLPLPALIDVTLADAGAADRVRRALAPVAPGARLDTQASALMPARAFLALLATLSAAIIAMMLAATALVVVLAARAGLEAHRQTIEVMHMLGATDVQVARLFQRRLARDAALGAVIGGLAGLAVVLALAVQAGGLGSELLGAVTLGRGGWAAVALLPIVFIVLAALVARRAVVASLRRVL